MKKEQNNAGFTLIEMAIGLVIIGLLILPVLELYKTERKSRILSFNASQFSTSKDNINFYATHEGRYPIPASLLAAPNDADYGTEVVGPIEDCTSWPTANGVCSTGGTDPILIGAIPFQEIGINQDLTQDYWHNKILYAITESQTVTYSAGAGKITTKGYNKLTPRELIEIETDVDMILISHGETGRGAYTQDGTLILACDLGTPSADQENCDMDNTFVLKTNNNFLIAEGSVSLAENADFYDDDTEDQRSVPVDLWLQNLIDPSVSITLATRIGIGTEDPQAKLHVVGDIRADQILSDNICNAASANCFDPTIIAGNVPEMDCGQNSLPGDQPVINLGNNQVYCASPVDSDGNTIDGENFQFPTDFGRINCADNAQLMTGIDVNGDPICTFP